MEFKIEEIRKMSGKIKGRVWVSFGDMFKVSVLVFQGQNSLFTSWPGSRSKDGKWYDNFMFISDEFKGQVEASIMDAFVNVPETQYNRPNPSQQQQPQPQPTQTTNYQPKEILPDDNLPF